MFNQDLIESIEKIGINFIESSLEEIEFML